MLVCQSISHISNSLAIMECRVYVAVGCRSNYKKDFFSVHIVAKLYGGEDDDGDDKDDDE